MTGKIIHLTNDLINRSEWDQWIRNTINRRIYATSLFLDIFSPRWEALIMDGGEAFMPLTRNSKYGITYLFQPLFVQQLGCFLPDDSYSHTFPLFIEKLTSSFRFIDISLNEMNYLCNPGCHTGKMSNYLLRLDGHYESISKRYNQNTRRNIIKAERLGAELQPHFKASDIVRLFAVNNGRLYPNIRRVNYKRLQFLLERGVTEGFIKIRTARANNGEIIAAACFLKDFDRYVFYFSANTIRGKEYGAMFLLIDSFIKEYAGSDMLLDFNGSVNPGIARFYSGFGAKKTFYPQLRINRLWYPFNYLK